MILSNLSALDEVAFFIILPQAALKSPSQSVVIPVLCCVLCSLLPLQIWLHFTLNTLAVILPRVTAALIFCVGTTVLVVSQIAVTSTLTGTGAIQGTMVGGVVMTIGPKRSPPSLLSLSLWEICLRRQSKETWMLYSRT